MSIFFSLKAYFLNTFEEAASQHPFRTKDAFLATYKHEDGYVLYLIGTEYFDFDDGPVTININNSVKVETAVDYVTGKEFEIEGNKIKTSIPGGVIRALYVSERN